MDEGLDIVLVDSDTTISLVREGGHYAGSPDTQPVAVDTGCVGIQIVSTEQITVLEGNVIDVRRLLVEAIEMLSAVEPSVGADIAVGEPT